MQALLKRKAVTIGLLMITTVVTRERDAVEESGRRLVKIAEIMWLNFSFDVIFVPDINDVREEFFDIEQGENVAVHASMVLKTMISRQDSLEKLTRVIRNLHPAVMA